MTIWRVTYLIHTKWGGMKEGERTYPGHMKIEDINYYMSHYFDELRRKGLTPYPQFDAVRQSS